MPNWCNNRLIVTGNADDMRPFVERATATLNADQSLCSWYPLPDSASKTVEFTKPDGTTGSYTAFTDTGYETALDMWGTKWGDCDTYIHDQSESSIEFGYQTAWANADRLIQRMSAEYPALRFAEVFQETGMCFCGYGVYKGGVTVAFESFDMEYPEYKDEMTDEEEDARWEKQCEIESEYWNEMLDHATSPSHDEMGVTA